MPPQPRKEHFKVDPITHEIRGKHWTQQEMRLNHIIEEGAKARGYNRKYWQRLIRVPEKIDQIAIRRRIPAFQAMQKKALLTARMLATYTDHMLKSTEISYQKMGEKALTPMEKQELWDKYYDDTLERYKKDPKKLKLEDIKRFDKILEYPSASREHMAERNTIAHLMEHLPDLTTPPKKILLERQIAFEKHNGQMKKFIQVNSKHTAQEREQMLMKELQHILTENVSEEQKAHKICIAASIFADSEKMDPARKDKTWTYNYANAMFMIYDALKNEHPTIVDAIRKLE
ncbi:MAG: hypothetical protein WC462_04515 [archaeon]